MRRERRVDWAGVYITAALGCGVAFALFLFLVTAPAHGQSSVDPAVPATNAALVSSVVRDNFANAAADIDNLFLRFPGSTSVTSVPAWSTSDGFLGDPGKCFIFTTGGGVPFFSCNSAVSIGSYANSSAFPSLAVDVSGGSANILQLRNSSNLWTWTNTGSLTTDFPGVNQFNITSQGANLNWIGTGSAADVFQLDCQGLITGDCLDISEDGTTRLKLDIGGEFTLTAAGATPLNLVSDGTLPSARITTTTTGDDPTEYTMQARVATTNATQTTLFTLATESDRVYNIEVVITARVTGGAGGNAGTGAVYHLGEGFKNVSGTVTRLTGSAATAIHSKESNSAYDAQINISTTNIIVQVTGAATDNVTWHANVTYSSVGS